MMAKARGSRSQVGRQELLMGLPPAHKSPRVMPFSHDFQTIIRKKDEKQSPQDPTVAPIGADNTDEGLVCYASVSSITALVFRKPLAVIPKYPNNLRSIVERNKIGLIPAFQSFFIKSTFTDEPLNSKNNLITGKF